MSARFRMLLLDSGRILRNKLQIADHRAGRRICTWSVNSGNTGLDCLVRWMQEQGTSRTPSKRADMHTAAASYPDTTLPDFSDERTKTRGPRPGCAAYGNITVVVLVWPANLVPQLSSPVFDSTLLSRSGRPLAPANAQSEMRLQYGTSTYIYMQVSPSW
jgi:hypothetical protein